MTDLIKIPDSNHIYRWFEHNRSKNENEELAQIRKQKLLPVLSNYDNKYQQPLYTHIYRSTLEDQSNTQIILIDRILDKLDEIQFKISPDQFDYNGYLYNSPTHKNIICWRSNSKENNDVLSFSFDQPKDKKKYLKSNNENLSKIPRINKKIPIQPKTSNQKDLPVLDSFLDSLQPTNSRKTKIPTNLPIPKDKRKLEKSNPLVEQLSPTKIKKNNLPKNLLIRNDSNLSFTIVKSPTKKESNVNKTENLLTYPGKYSPTISNSNIALPNHFENKNKNNWPINNENKNQPIKLNTDQTLNQKYNIPNESIINSKPSQNLNKVTTNNFEPKEPPRFTKSPQYTNQDNKKNNISSPKQTVPEKILNSTIQSPKYSNNLDDKNRAKHLPSSNIGPSNDLVSIPKTNQQSPDEISQPSKLTALFVPNKNINNPSNKETNFNESSISDIASNQKSTAINKSAQSFDDLSAKNSYLPMNSGIDSSDKSFYSQETNPSNSADSFDQFTYDQKFNTDDDLYNHLLKTKQELSNDYSDSSDSNKQSLNNLPSKLKLKEYDYTQTPQEILKQKSNFNYKKYLEDWYEQKDSSNSDKQPKTAKSDINKSPKPIVYDNLPKKYQPSEKPLSEINSQLDYPSIKEESPTNDSIIKTTKEQDDKNKFVLNIFYEKFNKDSNLPESNDSKLPLVFDCQPVETSPRLKNILLKLYFDLDKYMTNEKTPNNLDLDAKLISIKHPNNMSLNESQIGNYYNNHSFLSSASFDKTESELVLNPNQLDESYPNSFSTNTMISRDTFFENLKNIIKNRDESNDENDVDTINNLHKAYGILLKAFHEKERNQLRQNESFQPISSALSDYNLEDDENASYIDDLNGQSSEAESIRMNTFFREMDKIYKDEQKKLASIHSTTNSIPIDKQYIQEEEKERIVTISDLNSNEQSLIPKITKSKIETDSSEKMNISSEMDDLKNKPTNTSKPVIPKTPKTSSIVIKKTETDSMEQMNISTEADDSEDKIKMNFQTPKNTHIGPKGYLTLSSEMDKIYDEEDKKFHSSGSKLNSASESPTNENTFSTIKSNEKPSSNLESMEPESTESDRAKKKTKSASKLNQSGPSPLSVFEKLELEKRSFIAEALKLQQEESKFDIHENEAAKLNSKDLKNGSKKERSFHFIPKNQIETETESSDSNVVVPLPRKKKKTPTLKSDKSDDGKLASPKAEKAIKKQDSSAIKNLIRQFERDSDFNKSNSNSSSDKSNKRTEIGGLMVTKEFNIDEKENKGESNQEERTPSRAFSDQAGSILRKLKNHKTDSDADVVNKNSIFNKNQPGVDSQRSFSEQADSLLRKKKAISKQSLVEPDLSLSDKKNTQVLEPTEKQKDPSPISILLSTLTSDSDHQNGLPNKFYEDLKKNPKLSDNMNKSNTVSEELPEIDEYSRSSLLIQDDLSKASFTNKSNKTNPLEITSKSTIHGGDDIYGEQLPDFGKEMEIEETKISDVIILPPKMESNKSPKKHSPIYLTKNLSDSSGEYNIPTNKTLKRKGKPDLSEVDEAINKPNFLVTEPKEKRPSRTNSFILDSILLNNPKKLYKSHDDIYHVEPPSSEVDDTLKSSQKAIENVDAFLEALRERKRKIASDISDQDSTYSISPVNKNTSNIDKPSKQTIEIYEKLKSERSNEKKEKFDDKYFEIEKVSNNNNNNNNNNNVSKINTMSGRQRKPNEEILNSDEDNRLSKSSSTASRPRSAIIRGLFNREKPDKKDDKDKNSSSVGNLKKIFKK